MVGEGEGERIVGWGRENGCMEGEERKGERGGRVNGQMGMKLFVGAVYVYELSLVGVRHSLCSDG